MFNLTLISASVAVAGGAGPVTLAVVEHMTSAQIQRLSQDQVDALVIEADHRVTNFLDTTLKGPLPGPVWPSADLTSDGCSFPVAAADKTAFDTNACRHHDYGYRNLAQHRQTHSETVRRVIDTHLLNDLHLQCLNDSAANAVQSACDQAAVAAYVQARKTGASAFNAVQVHFSNP